MAFNMFTDFELTRCITEHFTDFENDTLLEKKPVRNWPKTFANEAIPYIKKQLGDSNQPAKILIVHGGAGRVTLELLRGCNNLAIDHTETKTEALQVLQKLLEDSKVQWLQQVEGALSKPMMYKLNAKESAKDLLLEKNNTVSYWQADYTDLHPHLDGYDIIIADFRYKVEAQILNHISSRLKKGGVLVLANLEPEVNFVNSLNALYDPITTTKKEIPNIYQETRNENHYAISYFTVWKKTNETHDGVKKIDNSNKSQPMTTAEYYEDDDILNSYQQFHFGPGHLGVSNFPSRVAALCIDMCKELGVNMNTVLEAGCGPGGCSVNLCKAFKQVESYDYSESFVEMLQQRKSDERLNNLSVSQGDAHKQAEKFTGRKFNLILGSNLIDRLHTPREWVLQSKGMLAKNGALVISSPYTWMANHTDPSQFLGGFVKDGEEITTVNGLCKLLEPELCLYKEIKVPYVIPDADGTYQYAYSNCTVFTASR